MLQKFKFKFMDDDILKEIKISSPHSISCDNRYSRNSQKLTRTSTYTSQTFLFDGSFDFSVLTVVDYLLSFHPSTHLFRNYSGNKKAWLRLSQQGVLCMALYVNCRSGSNSCMSK